MATRWIDRANERDTRGGKKIPEANDRRAAALVQLLRAAGIKVSHVLPADGEIGAVVNLATPGALLTDEFLNAIVEYGGGYTLRHGGEPFAEPHGPARCVALLRENAPR